MTCPDFDRLLDYVDGAAEEHGIEEHVRTCPRCALDVRILRDARSAFFPEIAVPDYLVERVVAAAEAEVVRDMEAAHAAGPSRKLDAWITAGLAASTAVSAVVVTRSFGPGTEPVHFALLAVVSGFVAYWFERAGGVRLEV